MLLRLLGGHINTYSKCKKIAYVGFERTAMSSVVMNLKILVSVALFRLRPPVLLGVAVENVLRFSLPRTPQGFAHTAAQKLWLIQARVPHLKVTVCSLYRYLRSMKIVNAV